MLSLWDAANIAEDKVHAADMAYASAALKRQAANRAEQAAKQVYREAVAYANAAARVAAHASEIAADA